MLLMLWYNPLNIISVCYAIFCDMQVDDQTFGRSLESCLIELSCEGFLTCQVFNPTHSLYIHSLLLLSVQPTPILKKCTIV